MKKIHATYIIIFLLSTLATIQFILLNEVRNRDKQISANAVEAVPQCTYSIGRTGGYRFIKPLLDAKQECESPKYMSVKSDISVEVDSLRNNGSITSASVYLQDFKLNDWINYNESEKFNPGSLLKVPLLMAFMRMNEDAPGLLNKEVLCEKHNAFGKNPVFLSKAVELGKSYSIRQLLEYTICYSDNDAYAMLCENVSVPVWKKTFTDLGLSSPDWFSPTYPITAKEYSVFMDALYNASYLTIKDSEFASELLSRCDFTAGMKKSLPDTVLLIHKFGEAGDLHTKELHESGIIYINNSPYLLTIMTRGRDMEKLPGVVRQLSKLVYNDMVRYRG